MPTRKGDLFEQLDAKLLGSEKYRTVDETALVPREFDENAKQFRCCGKLHIRGVALLTALFGTLWNIAVMALLITLGHLYHSEITNWCCPIVIAVLLTLFLFGVHIPAVIGVVKECSTVLLLFIFGYLFLIFLAIINFVFELFLGIRTGVWGHNVVGPRDFKLSMCIPSAIILFLAPFMIYAIAKYRCYLRHKRLHEIETKLFNGIKNELNAAK